MLKKGLREAGAIVIILLFVTTSIMPAISAETHNDKSVLFFDDFNDNTKDYSKWSEYYTDGQWYEQNQRTEFYVSNTGWSEANFVGIISIPITIEISNSNSVKINWTTNTYLNGTTSYGQLRFDVTDGENLIRLNYYRTDNLVEFKDSHRPEYGILGYKDDGQWTNQIEIFSDRYRILACDNEFDTGWIYESLFSLSTSINVKMYLKLQAPGEFLSSFDEIKVFEGNSEPENPLIDGPAEGKFNTRYTFYLSSTDPDNDQIKYRIDWGDNSSDTTGYYASGEELSINHSWLKENRDHHSVLPLRGEQQFTIKAKAIDSNGAESDWTTMEVVMPKTPDNPWMTLLQNILYWLTERFPFFKCLLSFA